MQSKWKKALALFTTFFRIGAFTFGGGYAMIPLIQKETVENHGWITDDDILEIIAIAESTPGPIAINSATFVGYRTCGVLGAACATFGVVLPSFLIILLITAMLKTALKNRYVQAVLWGVKPCVIGIVLATGIDMVVRNGIGSPMSVQVDIRATLLMVFLAAGMILYRKCTKKKLSPILLIVIAAFLGAGVYGI